MPVSRLLTEGLAEQVAAAYADAEVRLLRLIAQRLEAGAESPTWAEDKLAELQLFRARARRVMEGATAEATDALQVALRTAYVRGLAAGQGDADALGVDIPGELPQAERQVAALHAAMTEQWQGMELQVVRSTADAYRDAVVRASTGTLTGASTRLQDAQVALDDLARRGVTGFTDTAGRRWALPSYVEMATRSVTTQAAVAGHIERLEQAGINLFLVSNSSRECELCRPWEGKVLSRGPVAAITRNALTGEPMRVDVDGTVEEATRAGLFHPNCTHNLSGYVPGATRRGDATSNPEGYAERQEQRRLERKVREWKRREAAAMTPEAKARARAKVREWQGAVKSHTDATGLRRKPEREKLWNPAAGSKWDRWAAGRNNPVGPDNLPDFNPDNPLEFYGDKLTVTGRGDTVRTHMEDLELFSEQAHTTLRNHFADRPGAGIYLGDKAVPELDDLGRLRGTKPRGHGDDDTWDTVPGAYDPTTRVCACGGGGHGHGATSLALHEGSHALDDALGMASSSPRFVEVFHEVHGLLRMNPYYTHPANPTGYLSEAFAEGYAAFTKARSKGREQQVDAVGRALAGYEPGGPQTRAALGKLVDYFSSLG